MRVTMRELLYVDPEFDRPLNQAVYISTRYRIWTWEVAGGFFNIL